MTRTFGTLTRVPSGWYILAEPHVMIRLKRLFSKIDEDAKGGALLSDSTENALDIVWFTGRFPLKTEDGGYLKERAAAQLAIESKVTKLLSGDYTPRDFPLALPLRAYQKLAVELATRTQRLLLADEVGLGKSAASIGMLTEPGARPALVVTLTHLPRQWQAEVKRFLPSAATHIVRTSKPYQIGGYPDVVIMNYHKLSEWQYTLAGRFRTVIFDEVQELRRTESLKYKAAQHIAEKARLRVGLTATPIYNFGGEIWALMEVLAPGALGTWHEFRREWCGDAQGPGADQHSKIQVKNIAALSAMMSEKGLMLRRTRRDVNRELPALTNVPHTIDADLREIDKIASDAAELARIILAQGGRERGEQMRASEELSWRLRQATGLAKAPFVADFVRMLVESGERVLLAGWHKAVYKLWAERLKGLDPVFFTGDESIPQKLEAKQKFVDGKAQVLVMSLRAGAGIDGLQKVCRTVVFGELDWSPGVHHQFTGRIHRDGQPDPVMAYYLVADSGSDPVVSDTLGLKKQQSDDLLDPRAPRVEMKQADPARVKRLAEEFLRQRGIRRAA
jgi:superfamily II DNA or RNA helicase